MALRHEYVFTTDRNPSFSHAKPPSSATGKIEKSGYRNFRVFAPLRDAFSIKEKLRMFRMHAKARLLFEKARSAYNEKAFTFWKQFELSASARRQVESHLEKNPNDEIVLGHIDNDGRVLGTFGDLPGLQNISKANFIKRYRFPLDIVQLDGKVLIRKDYQGDQVRFVNEWYNLALLHGKANIPPVYRVDEDKCRLYKNFLPYPTIRDTLVSAGARILNIQTDDDRELAGLPKQARLEAILARGTALLSSCFPESFFQKLEKEVSKLHALKVAGLSLTFGNIVVDPNSGVPWFIDMEGAKAYLSVFSPAFIYKRSQDRAKFEKIYPRSLLKYRSYPNTKLQSRKG